MSDTTFSRCPDYLVIGHVARDMLRGGGSTPGGTATYSAMAAQRLGMQAAVVTACAAENESLLSPLRDEGVWVKVLPSPATTTFSNLYDETGRRSQVLSGQARVLGLDDVPEAWRTAPIVHLGPIAQELPPEMPRQFAPELVLGVTPQGWMRSWDGQGRVTHSAVPVPAPLMRLPSNAVLVLSIEDVGYNRDVLTSYINLAFLTVVTQGVEPALIYKDGTCYEVTAFPAEVVDLTGAGDVFATAFFVRYAETKDAAESARFAHAAAACAIEGWAIVSIPHREAVEHKLKRET